MCTASKPTAAPVSDDRKNLRILLSRDQLGDLMIGGGGRSAVSAARGNTSSGSNISQGNAYSGLRIA